MDGEGVTRTEDTNGMKINILSSSFFCIKRTSPTSQTKNVIIPVIFYLYLHQMEWPINENMHVKMVRTTLTFSRIDDVGISHKSTKRTFSGSEPNSYATLSAAPSRAPSNTYIDQTAAHFRAPLTNHMSNPASLFTVPTKQLRKAISSHFWGPARQSQFISSNQRSVYFNQSQVGLFWPITGSWQWSSEHQRAERELVIWLCGWPFA